MNILKGILKALLVLVILSAAALYVLANHSVTQTALTCTGTWEKGIGEWQGHTETVFAVIEEYRPWVLWGEGDGNLRAESREFPSVLYAARLRRIGSEPMTLYHFAADDSWSMIGGYRSAFKELTLQFSDDMVFSGTCESTAA